MKVFGIRQQGSIYSESPSWMFLSLQYEQKIFLDKHMAINVALFFFLISQCGSIQFLIHLNNVA